MYTPVKSTHRILNSSYTPFSSLASSKASTNCDFQRDDSGSMSKKKFTRKREGSNDSLKRFRVLQTDRKLKTKQINPSPQNIEQSFEKADKLLSKLSFKKQPTFATTTYVKLPTDRSHYSRDNQSMNGSFIIPSLGRNTARNKTEQDEFNFSMIDYKMQLEMKISEFMILEDQNGRLKKELKNKETQKVKIEKQKQNIKLQHEDKLRNLNEKIKKLQTQILLKEQTIERGQKTLSKARQQVRKSENQIELLKIHIDQLMTKKIPKNTLEIISYRQTSLQNQVSLLKQQLSLSQSQTSHLLENELKKTQQKLSQINQDNSSLSIANRVLAKKTQEVDQSLQKKFKSEVAQLKQKMKQLIKEASILKKQNVQLRKKIFQYEKKSQKQTYPLRIGLNKRNNNLWSTSKKGLEVTNQNASDDSFSFSLSR